jgi:hypothetical protein
MGTDLHSQQSAVDYLAVEIVRGHPHRDGKILLLSNCLGRFDPQYCLPANRMNIGKVQHCRLIA